LFSIFSQFFLQNGPVRLHLVAKRHDHFAVATHLRGYTRHTGPTEAVKNEIPRLRVVKEVTHDGLMRHLGVIWVHSVNWVVLTLAHISRKGFPVIVIAFGLLRLLCLPLGDEVGNPWVRAGGVVRRIAQLENVLILTDRKTFDLAE